MLAHKNKFFSGLVLMIAFLIVLILFLSPIFQGKNGLDYLDNLYNCISKGSAYYIPKAKAEGEAFIGKAVDVTLHMASPEQAEKTALLYRAAGAKVVVSGADLKVQGDLGRILENALADADAMYFNEGEKVSGKYGYNERLALYNWWKAFKEMERDLKKQKQFKEAKVVDTALTKAIEASYNYYGIQPQKIGEKWGIVLLSLVFYVVYTLWYGYSIMFMFEGWGLRLEH
jgi:hypothetical protein